jgi:UDPglucose 6-dehydrogenase
MQICVMGTGYVGLVVGTCMADMGFTVICVDTDPEKVAMLRDGKVPIYEPGLEDVMRRVVRKGRLTFSGDAATSIGASEVVYIAVGTPSNDAGACDLRAVYAVAETIGQHMKQQSTVIIKSTVPVGTADAVRERIDAHTDHVFDVVSNPEFLKEGAAVDDFTHPDRIVIGCSNARSVDVMQNLYSSLVRTGRPIVFMDNRSAELTKYAANALLAMKISFMNEMARLCTAVNADVESIRLGVGADSRIGPRFLFAGAGFGGSCFPKDIRALHHQGLSAGVELEFPLAVERVNGAQKRVLGQRIQQRFGADLTGRTFGVWGLAFKPKTDDVRESPALVLIEMLVAAGASIQAYDPEAMEAARSALVDMVGVERVRFVPDPMAAAHGADALVVVTEWSEFRNPDLRALAENLTQPIVFDGRNIFPPEVMVEAGLEYHGIGRRK